MLVFQHRDFFLLKASYTPFSNYIHPCLNSTSSSLFYGVFPPSPQILLDIILAHRLKALRFIQKFVEVVATYSEASC